jgi:hypothetical protein
LNDLYPYTMKPEVKLVVDSKRIKDLEKKLIETQNDNKTITTNNYHTNLIISRKSGTCSSQALRKDTFQTLKSRQSPLKQIDINDLDFETIINDNFDINKIKNNTTDVKSSSREAKNVSPIAAYQHSQQKKIEKNLLLDFYQRNNSSKKKKPKSDNNILLSDKRIVKSAKEFTRLKTATTEDRTCNNNLTFLPLSKPYSLTIRDNQMNDQKRMILTLPPTPMGSIAKFSNN